MKRTLEYGIAGDRPSERAHYKVRSRFKVWRLFERILYCARSDMPMRSIRIPTLDWRYGGNGPLSLSLTESCLQFFSFDRSRNEPYIPRTPGTAGVRQDIS